MPSYYIFTQFSLKVFGKLIQADAAIKPISLSLFSRTELIMRKYLVFIFAVMISGAVKAQDPHFSQFFASPLTLNPAFTGKFDGSWRLAANHRDQWPSIPKAYVTTSASFDFPILKSRIPENDVFGVGISGVSDA